MVLKKVHLHNNTKSIEQNNETLENKLKTINAKYYIDATSNTTSIDGYHIIYTNNKEKYGIKIYQKD